MKITGITIQCPCGESYVIDRVQGNRTQQNLIIDAATCPYCSQPRDIGFYQRFRNQKRCIRSKCNIPLILSDYKSARGLCSRCYQKMKRKNLLYEFRSSFAIINIRDASMREENKLET